MSIQNPSPYAIREGDAAGVPIPGGLVLFDPYPEQVEMMRICQTATARNIFIWGDREGGKSTGVRWYAHLMAKAYPRFRYMILRGTIPQLRITHLNELYREERLLNKLEKGHDWNKSEKQFVYPNDSIGYFRSCDDEAAMNDALGVPDLHLVIFDEAPSFQWEHLTSIQASARAPLGSPVAERVIYLGNPFGPSAVPLKLYFIEKDVERIADEYEDTKYKPEDYQQFKMMAANNPYSDPVQRQKRYSSIADPAKRKAWERGEFADEDEFFDFKPTIIDATKQEIEYHVISELPLHKGHSLLEQTWVHFYRSYDDGWYPDPAVCLWHLTFENRIIVFHERQWNKTTIEDIAYDILEDSKLPLKPGQKQPSDMPVLMTFCDPKMETGDPGKVYNNREQFDNEGVWMEASINNRELYARSIQNALATEVAPGVPRIQFLRHGCPNLIKTLPKMQRNPNHPERLADHPQDHWTVALAYFLISYEAHYESNPPPPPNKRRMPWMVKGRRTPLGAESVRRH